MLIGEFMVLMSNVGVILGMPVLHNPIQAFFLSSKNVCSSKWGDDKWGVRVALDGWRLWFTSYLTDWIPYWVKPDLIHPH